jgi:hypothetical protein
MSNASLEPTSSVVRLKEILSAEVGNEVVLMSTEKGVYYGLNPVGAWVWSLLGEPVPVHELCEKIVEEFEVTLEQCQEEVLELLKELQEQGLISIVEEGQV